ncbi:hypothetical protein G4B88_002465 [Cannabis sativa]|uniref:Uncharacterized protein n=1 Tax=Cannabis sativa TaxID=3483 RepID=A0A7J6I7L8_CANSA|nr:hypothetical protein G4B88_002465 [Cannabis sativa]
MIKAMKKLKIWSKKKRKKKALHSLPCYLPPPSRLPPPPPPPPLQAPIQNWCCSCSCSCSQSKAEPSAPPLPSSWYYDSPVEAHHESIVATGIVEYPTSSADAGEDGDCCDVVEDQSSSSSSYQQYMVPNPVYGIPVVVAERERSGGVFGCVVNFGRHLFRCFFPCYRI